ncbi:4Fe-4S cluster-binding domain-containing protein [Streptomyces eurythermus]
MSTEAEGTSTGPESARTGSGGTRTRLSVARTLDRCTVLGPGSRAVIWVQGCPLRCPGCVAAETLPFEGGTSRTVHELAEWLCGLDAIEGVTFSGG